MVLQDVWQPKHGVSLMAREGVTYTAASTPFLSDICDVVKAGAPSPASLRSFLCGGAPIPSVLIERAASELGIKVCSLWGMTEILAATLTEPSRASDKSPTTDGRPLEGMEVRIVDFDGMPVPTGQSGRLLVRGCQLFTGYYKRPELQTFDAQGWFDSGDLAAIQAYLAECKMAKQFWPERVQLVTDLPRTASGKIQKFKLKEVAEAFGDGK